MAAQRHNYSQYVEHPRYGRGPRYTNVDVRERPIGYRLVSYQSDDVIQGTAVEADLERQSPSPVPVLYYLDLRRVCVDCGRAFLFFAEEQKYWYEELGFDLSADCIRCIECRKRHQGLERHRRRYEELFHNGHRSPNESLDMAECCLELMRQGLFHRRQTERVRMLLNSISSPAESSVDERRHELRQRLLTLEAAFGAGQGDGPGAK